MSNNPWSKDGWNITEQGRLLKNDPSLAKVYMSQGLRDRKIIPCIAIVACGRLLLLQRGDQSKYPHTWCIPGGKIEPGESPIDCAAREMTEETGIPVTVDDMTFLGDYDSGIIDGDGRPYVLRVFFVKYDQRPPVKIEPGFEGYGWFTPVQINGLSAMAPALKVSITMGLDVPRA